MFPASGRRVEAVSAPALLALSLMDVQAPVVMVAVQRGPLVSVPPFRILICAPTPGSSARQA